MSNPTKATIVPTDTPDMGAYVLRELRNSPQPEKDEFGLRPFREIHVVITDQPTEETDHPTEEAGSIWINAMKLISGGDPKGLEEDLLRLHQSNGGQATLIRVHAS